MSRIIKLLNNETIEIVEYSKANACFQTNKYPNDELFCVIREQINPFDMFQKKLSLEQEIDRLNNIINELVKYIKDDFDIYCCNNKTKKTFKSVEIIIKAMILDKIKELKENK